MKTAILFASVTIASGVLLVNVYNSMIDATSWGSDIPNSIATAREYFRVVNPGTFMRIFTPLNQVLALLTLILFWKTTTPIRLTLGAALAFYILVDVSTFAFFYPRNDIMFKTAQLTDVETLKNAWSGWNFVNWIRSGVQFAGLVFSWISLQKIFLLK